MRTLKYSDKLLNLRGNFMHTPNLGFQKLYSLLLGIILKSIEVSLVFGVNPRAVLN